MDKLEKRLQILKVTMMGIFLVIFFVLLLLGKVTIRIG